MFGDGIIKAVRTDDGYILSDDIKRLCRETVYYIEPDGTVKDSGGNVDEAAMRAAAQIMADSKNNEKDI